MVFAERHFEIQTCKCIIDKSNDCLYIIIRISIAVTNGQLKYSFSILGSCAISCNYTIPHDHIMGCSGVLTEVSLCPYSCDEGYEVNADVPYLYVSCSSKGAWISTWLGPSVTIDFCKGKYHNCTRFIFFS